MMIYTYANSSANVARDTIHADNSPRYTRTRRHVDSNKIGTAAYLAIYGTLAAIDVIACAKALEAIARLLGA